MASRKRSRKEQAPGWAWMLFGLSIGLAVALVVWLKSPSQPFTQTRSETVARGVSPSAVRGSAPPEALAAGSQEAGNGADQADAARSPAPEETRQTELSFYTDLRESEVVVPAGEFDFGTDADTPYEVIIQAGSFPAFQRADRRRSELAVLGIESTIDPAIVDGITFYRVNVGPLSERGEINRVVRRLREEGIDNFRREITN